MPTNVLMLASGNNLTFKGDMITRALLCKMDAGIEKPETRRFDVDLKAEIPKLRPELVAAGLTASRAFVVAGRPSLRELEPFGRFEEWSNLVRGALVWLGEANPCKTRAYIAVDDPERSDLGQLLAAVVDNIEGWWTAKQLVEVEASDGILEEAIEQVGSAYNPRKLGNYLRTKEGRIVNGLKLEGRDDKSQKIKKYRVVKV